MNNLSKRAQQIIHTLIAEQPEARCTLDYGSDWQLLFAAILASQCTDERVNKVTQKMYKNWPRLDDYANMDLEILEEAVRSCGLYHNKAKNIQASARLLIEEYQGHLPSEVKSLEKFPGVGRKIANLLVGELFGQAALVVDTHCGRLARLFGLSKAKAPLQVERDLAKVVPQEYWIVWGHHMVELGRSFCKAKCRQCAACPVSAYCAYGQSVTAEQEKVKRQGDIYACL